jgi:hypothetical protein
MAPPDARASASYGCSAFLSYCLRWLPGSDRLGTIDLPCRRSCGGVIQCRAIVPNGSARRASGGVFRLFGLFVLLVAVALGSDRLGTIDLPCRRASGGVLQCRAIVPNGSARRVSGGFLRLFGFFCLTGRGGILVPIDWGQSIYHADAQAAVSYSVEPLSPMAPPDAQASASYGCSAVLSYWSRWHPGSDRLRTIDLPCRRSCGGVMQCRAIVPNGSARRASGGVLRLFGFFVLLVAVASRFRSIGDNRSTMPTHSGGVIQCRAIVPNGSARRVSGGFLRLFGFFVLLSAVASWFRSIGDNRSTMPTRKRRCLTV